MSEIKFWRYALPSIKGEGWAIVILDSSGMFAAVSDWGNFAFQWRHTGVDDFRKFVIDIDWDYARRKLTNEVRQVSDFDGIEKDIRAFLLKQRRATLVDKDDARREWDLLKGGFHSDIDFEHWAHQTDFDRPYDWHKSKTVYEAEAFCRHALPRLQAAIREELAREREAA